MHIGSQSFWLTDDVNPVFYLAIVTAFLANFISLIIFFVRLAILSHEYGIIYLQPYAAVSSRFMGTVIGQLCEDATLVLAMLATSLLLLATVLAGPCPAGTGPWQMQDCNPVGIANELPAERLLISTILILIVQMFIKGCRWFAIVLSWTVHIFIVNYCLAEVEANLFYWITVNIPIFCTASISYEIERQVLCRFISEKMAQITTKKLFTLELELANEKIKEGTRDLESKRSMVRHISHEIRTPLNTASIGVEVLIHELSRLGDTVPTTTMDLLDDIKAASSAALVIVNELLAFEKLAAGMFVLEITQSPIISFVHDIVNEFFIPSLAKEISLNLLPTQFSEDTIVVMIDPVKMAYVLRNLLSNAIKFTPRGGYIEISIIKPESKVGVEDHIVISVVDNGVGLSADNIVNLFQEGVQFNPNALQNGGGSGFGLFIAKGISDLHPGCSIWATSPGEGRGCCFSVLIPYVNSKLNKGTSTGNPEVVSNDEIESTGMDDTMLTRNLILNVLVVDDSVSNRKMLIRLLQIGGHKCSEADDGISAVREISLMFLKRDKDEPIYTQYDAVLIDSDMPKMCGPVAVAEMRGLGFMGAIIGITGHQNTSEFDAAGADMVLYKPVRLKEMNKGLHSVLQNRKKRTLDPKIRNGSSNQLKIRSNLIKSSF